MTAPRGTLHRRCRITIPVELGRLSRVINSMHALCGFSLLLLCEVCRYQAACQLCTFHCCLLAEEASSLPAHGT
jgi:hypothetical protein